jgi:ribosomal protein L37AE/L43A
MSRKSKIEEDKRNKNICPVCGNNAKLTLHHILPRFIFRKIQTDDKKFFLNGANSYWLCRKCHNKYEQNVNNLKNELLRNLSFPKIAAMPFILNPELRKIKNLCRFMAGRFSVNSYNYNIYEAYDFVKKYYNKPYLTYDKILELAEMYELIPNKKYMDVGNFLIEKLGVKELDNIFRTDLRKFLIKRNVSEKKLISKKNKYYEV